MSFVEVYTQPERPQLTTEHGVITEATNTHSA
jgi:hypothetical protein